MNLENLYDIFRHWANAGSVPSFFEHAFIVRGAIAAILIGPMLGIIGPVVAVRGWAFFVQTIGHAALTGVAIGLLIGEPMGETYIGLYGFCLIVGLLMLFLRNRLESSADLVTGVVLAQVLGIGIGMMVLVTQRFNVHQVEAVLFGSLLTVTESDLLILAITLVAVLLLLWVLFNKLLLAAFDTSLAQTRLDNRVIYDYVAVLLVTVIVVASLKIVGALLVLALIVIPTAAAQRLASSFGAMVRWSIVLATLSSLFGFLLSAVLPIPSGAAIVLVASIWFYLALLASAAFRSLGRTS